MKKNYFFFKNNVNFLSQNNINFIENIVLGKNFPYYFNFSKKTLDEKYLILTHIVQGRLENNSLKNIIKSPDSYDETLDILKNFCNSINEKYNFFTRICYNLTFNNGNLRSQIHQDHNYEHKQIIIYLNDCDKFSKTCIIDEKNKIIKEIIPEKFKGVCFNNFKHYHFFPKSGHRVVLVATYI
jgi:hypothetical protein